MPNDSDKMCWPAGCSKVLAELCCSLKIFIGRQGTGGDIDCLLYSQYNEIR